MKQMKSLWNSLAHKEQDMLLIIGIGFIGALAFLAFFMGPMP